MRNSESVQGHSAGVRTSVTNVLSHIPDDEYARRLGERQRQLVTVRDLHRRLWIYLIVDVLAGVVIVSVTFSAHLISPVWTLMPLVIALSITQSLIKNARTHGRVQRIVSFYELGAARLNHQWQGRGIGGKEFQPENHPYASDLDMGQPRANRIQIPASDFKHQSTF